MKLPALIIALFICLTAFGQNTTQLSLPDVIELSYSDAPDALLAKTRLSNNYWRYQSFLADYKPQMNLDGTLPSLNRSIQEVIQPDGSSIFIQRSLMRNSLALSLSQDIAFTGGTVFASTGLDRLDIFQEKSDNITSYFSNPITIGFFQPIFAFNSLKWAKEIEPLRYEEASRSYAEQMEQNALEATGLFFDLLISQLNYQAAAKDKANADTLFNISRGRFSVGRIAETELLQIELSAMNANASLAQASLNRQTNAERLRNFLGIRAANSFDLESPDLIPDFVVDSSLALVYARQHRSETIGWERRVKQAEQEVDRERRTGFNIQVSGQFGLSQTSSELNNAYTDLLDQERVTLGVQVPIADWGKREARRQIANSELTLEEMIVEQEKVNFEREVLLAVRQIDLLRNQVKLALRAYEVAQKRESITRKRYLIGKIQITDLNLALREQDEARQKYATALRAFWVGYYQLRSLTLYDFIENKPLFKRLDL